MKNIIVLFALVMMVGVHFSFSQKENFRPPGTVQIVDNFFFDIGEITNIDWKEYVYYQKHLLGENDLAYQNALPDTLVWKTEKEFNEPFVNTYYQHAAYNDYPVVGITHEQAMAYCAWRTKVVREMLKSNNHMCPEEFEYRLPTKTEWELVANAGFSEKTKKKITSKHKGEKLYNMKYKRTEKLHSLEGINFRMTSPAHSFLPNKYGVYNLYGNVAEMVAEKGIAKGGSFIHYYNDIVPTNKDLSYENASKWLGFRCVCEVVEY